jgi:hypothetical protein
VVNLVGREVTIVSQENGQQLADAKWVLLKARGFAGEKEANDFGAQLGTIIELAGVCCRLGVDVGGQDRPMLSMNEAFARSLGLLESNERLYPNVHGLAVLPDDDSVRFPVVKAEGRSHFDPVWFEGALTELAAGQQQVQLSAAAQGVRVLNLALINPQPLAQVVLAISAVEALGQDETWTEVQTALLADLAAQVEAGPSGQDVERKEVVAALRRGMHRVGLRQGVMRVLDGLGLRHMGKEWDRVYALRSDLFHGRAQLSARNRQVSEQCNHALWKDNSHACRTRRGDAAFGFRRELSADTGLKRALARPFTFPFQTPDAGLERAKNQVSCTGGPPSMEINPSPCADQVQKVRFPLPIATYAARSAMSAFHQL